MIAHSSRSGLLSVFKMYRNTWLLMSRHFKTWVASILIWLIMMTLFITPIGVLLNRMGLGLVDSGFDWFMPIQYLLKGLGFAVLTSGIMLVGETLMKGEKMKLRQLAAPLSDFSILKRILPMAVLLTGLFFSISWFGTMDFDYRDLTQKRSELEPWVFRWLLSTPILFPLFYKLPLLLNDALTPIVGALQTWTPSAAAPFNQASVLLSTSVSFMLFFFLSSALGLIVIGKQSTLSALSQALHGFSRNWVFLVGNWILLGGFFALIIFVSAWFSLAMIFIAPYLGYCWYRAMLQGEPS